MPERMPLSLKSFVNPILVGKQWQIHLYTPIYTVKQGYLILPRKGGNLRGYLSNHLDNPEHHHSLVIGYDTRNT